jgi:hypothetical protein
MNLIGRVAASPDRLPQYSLPGSPSVWRKAAGHAALALAMGVYGALFALFAQRSLLGLAIPLFVLAILVVWTLPEAKTGPVRLLQWLFFAFFFGLILWPDYLALTLPGLPWITLRRIISVPLAIILLVCISVSKEMRKEIKTVFQANPLVMKLFLAFVVLQLLSIAISRNPSVSGDKFIVAQLYWTTAFFAGCYIFARQGTVARWSALFCLMLIPLSISAYWEWKNSQVPWAGRIPWFLVVEDEVVARILAGGSRAATGIYRVQGTSTTSLGFAEYLAMTTPFLIHYVVGPFRPIIRAAALLALPLVYLMILATDSRLGVAGFLLSFVGYVGMWAAVQWRTNGKSLFGPALTLGFPLLFTMFLTATFQVPRLHRMVWGGGEHQASTDARAEQYSQGFRLLARNPFGNGIGMGAETLGFRNGADILTIDTYYLLVALEYGVLGFLIYYAFLIIAAMKAGLTLLRSPRVSKETLYLMPLTLSLAIFIVSKSVFSVEANHPLIFMMLAAILALIARARTQVPQEALSQRIG